MQLARQARERESAQFDKIYARFNIIVIIVEFIKSESTNKFKFKLVVSETRFE